MKNIAYRGWKLFRKDGQQLISCAAERPVVYPRGKWTRPYRKDGPLAVFETRSQAVKFKPYLDPYHRYVVLPVEFRSWTQPFLVERSVWRTSIVKWQFALWQENSGGIPFSLLPAHTRLASAVRVL